MKIDKTDIIKKVRIAIDEIMPAGANTTDTFWNDQDEEIWQAVRIAAEQLSLELPRELLEPVFATPDVTTDLLSGTTCISISASNYLALYELRMTDWKMSVTKAFQPGGVEEMQQQTEWTRGTIYKPKVMEVIGNGVVTLYYWTSSTNRVARFGYVPRPYIGEGADANKLIVGLRANAESYIIYRAGRLVLASKKETALAQEMEAICKSFVVN